MSLYNDAVEAIRGFSTKKQSELDSAAARARELHIATRRLEATDGLSPDSPALPVGQLLANTLSVGRDGDDYPATIIPESTIKAIQAALAAGMLRGNASCVMVGAISFHPDLSGARDGDGFEEDYRAWNAARQYRSAQQVRDL